MDIHFDVGYKESHDGSVALLPRWRHQMEIFLRHWPFVRGIHRSPVNSSHKGQWRGALMFSLICVWINYWVNNREAGDLRRYRAHYDVTVMGAVTTNFAQKRHIRIGNGWHQLRTLSIEHTRQWQITNQEMVTLVNSLWPCNAMLVSKFSSTSLQVI